MQICLIKLSVTPYVCVCVCVCVYVCGMILTYIVHIVRAVERNKKDAYEI